MQLIFEHMCIYMVYNQKNFACDIYARYWPVKQHFVASAHSYRTLTHWQKYTPINPEQMLPIL